MGGNVAQGDMPDFGYTKWGDKYTVQALPAEDVSIFCSTEELKKFYGAPISQYFNFLYFICVTNFIFFCISLIGFVPHAQKTNAMMKSVNAGFLASGTSMAELDILFLSSFQPSTDGSWTAMMTLGVIFSFLYGPLYFLASTYWFRDHEHAAEDDPTQQRSSEEQKDDEKADEIEENRDEEVKRGYGWRLALHYPLFILCCFLPGGVMYLVLFTIFYATVQGSFDSGASSESRSFIHTAGPVLLALVPSLIVVISNLLFETILEMLNSWDKHPTWTAFRSHRIFRTLVFR
jgi:hypothetical protein